MSEIQRYFTEARFDKFRNDIVSGVNPLPQTIRNSGGELDLQFRPDNRFNIYYKGNSLAEVQVQNENYKVKIHEEFDPVGSAGKDKKKRFAAERFKKSGKYFNISLNSGELLKFFQVEIIKALSSRIKSVNNGEEITFEQCLMTDNLDCEDLIIIDRQVGGGGITGFLDLLALKKIKKGKYRFVVIEVKLGNNKDLKGKVVGQVEDYIKGIKNNISEFKKCYEKNYAQKKRIGLFPAFFPDAIQIDEEVEGKIIVGLYSKIGDEYIQELENRYPSWKKGKNIIQFTNGLQNKV